MDRGPDGQGLASCRAVSEFLKDEFCLKYGNDFLNNPPLMHLASVTVILLLGPNADHIEENQPFESLPLLFVMIIVLSLLRGSGRALARRVRTFCASGGAENPGAPAPSSTFHPPHNVLALLTHYGCDRLFCGEFRYRIDS